MKIFVKPLIARLETAKKKLLEGVASLCGRLDLKTHKHHRWIERSNELSFQFWSL